MEQTQGGTEAPQNNSSIFPGKKHNPNKLALRFGVQLLAKKRIVGIVHRKQNIRPREVELNPARQERVSKIIVLVAILHSLILEPCFGIDRENMARGENLRYTRDAAEAIAEVDAGRAQAAFIINPTRVRQIKDVALAGDKMPQKSTYFYPKILTGLLFNHFQY